MAKTSQKARGGLGRRLRYEFDKSMAAGPIALIGWLAVLSLIVVAVAGGVIAKDHTIILNWSPSIFDIISELTIANQSRRRPRIVIMADRDKVEMEDEIAQKVPNLKHTRLICRSGDPTDLSD